MASVTLSLPAIRPYPHHHSHFNLSVHDPSPIPNSDTNPVPFPPAFDFSPPPPLKGHVTAPAPYHLSGRPLGIMDHPRRHRRFRPVVGEDQDWWDGECCSVNRRR